MQRKLILSLLHRLHSASTAIDPEIVPVLLIVDHNLNIVSNGHELDDLLLFKGGRVHELAHQEGF